MTIKLSPAQIQRNLEAKYGVIPCPWWFDFCALECEIDDVLAPTGTELVFKNSTATIVCGAGVFIAPGMMRFSACYGNDRYETRRSGKITGAVSGEAIRICNGQTGVEYDYHPTAVFWGGWYKHFLTGLFTMGTNP